MSNEEVNLNKVSYILGINVEDLRAIRNQIAEQSASKK